MFSEMTLIRTTDHRSPPVLHRLLKLKDTNVSFSPRLNSSDSDGEPMHIQMVTALVLQLIQCVVHLPSERDAEDEHNKKVEI